MVDLTKKSRTAVGTTVVAAIVVVVLIIAVVAGYYALTASGKTTTVTSVSTSTATSVTTSIATSTSISTSVSTSISTATSISSATVTSVSVSTQTQTTVPTPQLLPSGSSSYPTPSSPISEAGSSLLAPLFSLWATNFTALYPNVEINTAAGGSGAGQTGVEQNTTNLGGSDPFASPAQVQQYPDILNIAVAVSAQQVNYNLPGIPQTTHLNLTGNVLAGIYNGSITTWNNAAIQKLNPGVTLPSATIVPLHRSDSSGDTDLFTTYLSDTSSDWAKTYGAGNTVAWANVPSAAAENGNSGMLSACASTQYCIAYIGVSYLAQANGDGLGNAALQNLAGNFVQLTTANVESALNAQYSSTPPSERISLIYGPGATSYPIVNFEYVWVQKNQPSATLAEDIQAILYYATLPQDGNSAYFLNQVGFVALPPSIAALSWTQIASITG